MSDERQDKALFGDPVALPGAKIGGKNIDFGSWNVNAPEHRDFMEAATGAELIGLPDNSVYSLEIQKSLKSKSEEIFSLLRDVHSHFESNGLSGISLLCLRDRIAQIISDILSDPEER